MPPVRPLRLAPEWDDRYTWMCGVSAVAHAAVIVALVMLSARGGWKPLPLVAYTVEITDPNALGGRLPPGMPGRDLSGGEVKPAAPPPAARNEAPAIPVPQPVKPPEPTPVAKPPQPKAPEAKAPEPKVPEQKPAEPKVEPKPAPPPPEVKKPEPVKAEPPKPAATVKSEANPAEQKAPARPVPAPAGTGAAPATPHAEEATQPRDAYGAAAERWRARAGQSGGGLGGTDTGSGPVGAGGDGKGGGGQLVGLEFLAYRQQVINTIKSRWTNVILRAGLVAAVRFEIAADGTVSAIRLEQSSGNPAYDASAMRAVQQASPLPAPPARYQNDFHEFAIEFHSEEQGGGTG